jgi:hypothetical protein
MNDTDLRTRATWRASLSQGWPLLLTMALVLAGLAAAHRLRPAVTRDTSAYLRPGDFVTLLGAPRSPAYQWLLPLLQLGSGSNVPVPWVQTLAFLLATWCWFRACLDAGLSRGAALALALPLPMSNLLLLWNNAIHPELPAAVALVFALSQLMAMLHHRKAFAAVTAYGAALGLSYLLRPANLPLVAVLPLLYVALSRVRTGGWQVRRALALAGAGAAAFLLVGALRLAFVGSFNIVSFGGFQMSGLAGQMLDEEAAAKLPAEFQPLGQRVVQGRAALVAAGKALPTPENSEGRRDYFSVALGYFDILARNYDAVLYGVILRERQPDESWVAFDRRLQRFALATLHACPQRYAAWVLGASMRATGRLLMANGAWLTASLALAVAYLRSIVRRRSPPSQGALSRNDDVHVVVLLVAGYTLATLALQVLVTFPAARYIDTAGLLLPALPLYGLARLLGSAGGTS